MFFLRKKPLHLAKHLFNVRPQKLNATAFSVTVVLYLLISIAGHSVP
jgi:hypothetical protein